MVGEEEALIGEMGRETNKKRMRLEMMKMDEPKTKWKFEGGLGGLIHFYAEW